MALSSMSGNFPVTEGTLLASRYEVQAFLGEGSFGKVAKCVDTYTKTSLAIKITKDHPDLAEQALEEIEILKVLRCLDPDKSNIVRWKGSFFHQRLVCLRFELLDLSLRDYMRERHFQALTVQDIRPILHQVNTALLHLEALQIMHGDLKPDNIMIVDRWQQPLMLKIIDFGLACRVSDIVPGTTIQTLWYRAPEVLLGSNIYEPIDMWSLGVVAAELALGYPLFSGLHEYDVLRFIMETLGQPPTYELNNSKNTSQFFRCHGTFRGKVWRMKTPAEYAAETGHVYKDTRYYRFQSLDAMADTLCLKNKPESRLDVSLFVDLLKRMLETDQYARIMPLKVLEQPFFTVAQQPDSAQDTDCNNLPDDLVEVIPVTTKWPSPQDDSTGCKFGIFVDEIPFTRVQNRKPEDEEEEEEEEAAQSQLEAAPRSSSKTLTRLKNFFLRLICGQEIP